MKRLLLTLAFGLALVGCEARTSAPKKPKADPLTLIGRPKTEVLKAFGKPHRVSRYGGAYPAEHWNYEFADRRITIILNPGDRVDNAWEENQN